MKERCRDRCRTSLLIAGVILVPVIFHTSLPPCHPYIIIHFMEMIFSTCNYRGGHVLAYNYDVILVHKTVKLHTHVYITHHNHCYDKATQAPGNKSVMS